ncbi:hypothetical protein [Ferrovibrio sp.]|uniref:hypothetical protein n=1 Tax=Ferrovibrio sp. TaxID=1917215 RepID=UPI003D13D2BF
MASRDGAFIADRHGAQAPDLKSPGLKSPGLKSPGPKSGVPQPTATPNKHSHRMRRHRPVFSSSRLISGKTTHYPVYGIHCQTGKFILFLFYPIKNNDNNPAFGCRTLPLFVFRIH